MIQKLLSLLIWQENNFWIQSLVQADLFSIISGSFWIFTDCWIVIFRIFHPYWFGKNRLRWRLVCSLPSLFICKGGTRQDEIVAGLLTKLLVKMMCHCPHCPAWMNIQQDDSKFVHFKNVWYLGNLVGGKKRGLCFSITIIIIIILHLISCFWWFSLYM